MLVSTNIQVYYICTPHKSRSRLIWPPKQVAHFWVDQRETIVKGLLQIDHKLNAW